MPHTCPRVNPPAPRILSLSLIFVLWVMALNLTQANEALITADFNAFPDGTLVLPSHPFNGILQIQAEAAQDWYDYNTGESGRILTPAVIRLGSIEVLPVSYEWAYRYIASFTATFLEPVTDVSFKLMNYRTAGYQFSGLDAAGLAFSGNGSIDGLVEDPIREPWVTVSLTIPDGGYLSAFTIENRDIRPDDAAVWVDDISYAPIPEPTGGALLLLGLGLVGAHRFASRKLSPRPQHG